MKTDIAAVVVLYNPDKKFINNIYTYASHVSLLILVDNSEIPDHSFYESFVHDPTVKLIINNENTGIARAVNSGIELAAANGFAWAMVMDQDSFFKQAMIEKYLADFNKLADKNNIAVTGPVTDGKVSVTAHENIQNVTSLITSGSLINISIFIAIGGYNEQFFIDEVDHEYCYRAKLKGYAIFQLQDVSLEHSLGHQLEVTTLSGKNKLKSFHSPVRLYYIVRNCCYVIAAYKKIFPREMKLKRKDMLVRIKNNFLYGSHRLAVLRYVMLGFMHYKMNRFGKL
jgi:rhamnosyltransferase